MPSSVVFCFYLWINSPTLEITGPKCIFKEIRQGETCVVNIRKLLSTTCFKPQATEQLFRGEDLMSRMNAHKYSKNNICRKRPIFPTHLLSSWKHFDFPFCKIACLNFSSSLVLLKNTFEKCCYSKADKQLISDCFSRVKDDF